MDPRLLLVSPRPSSLRPRTSALSAAHERPSTLRPRPSAIPAAPRPHPSSLSSRAARRTTQTRARRDPGTHLITLLFPGFGSCVDLCPARVVLPRRITIRIPHVPRIRILLGPVPTNRILCGPVSGTGCAAPEEPAPLRCPAEAAPSRCPEEHR